MSIQGDLLAPPEVDWDTCHFCGGPGSDGAFIGKEKYGYHVRCEYEWGCKQNPPLYRSPEEIAEQMKDESFISADL